MDRKKIGKTLLFPPAWLLLLLTVVSTVGLVKVFVNGMEAAPVAYAIYVTAFYTLCVDCVFCALVLPKRYRQIRERILQNPLAKRYATDRIYRSNVSLNCSLGINIMYVAINVLSWYLYRSWWFVCL